MESYISVIRWLRHSEITNRENAVTPCEIYVRETKEAEKQGVFVLSAFPEFLVDYFGVKLWKTSVKHTKNERDKCEI